MKLQATARGTGNGQPGLLASSRLPTPACAASTTWATSSGGWANCRSTEHETLRATHERMLEKGAESLGQTRQRQPWSTCVTRAAQPPRCWTAEAPACLVPGQRRRAGDHAHAVASPGVGKTHRARGAAAGHRHGLHLDEQPHRRLVLSGASSQWKARARAISRPWSTQPVRQPVVVV